MTPTTYRILVSPKEDRQHNGRLYFLQGTLSPSEAQRLAQELLSDPVTEQFQLQDIAPDDDTFTPAHATIEVTLLPGVTDPPAENLLRAAHLLGISGLQRAATGQRYELDAFYDHDTLHALAIERYANPVIQRFALNQAITPPFFAAEANHDTVEIIPLREADDDELLAISQQRRLALNLPEMQAVRGYYQTEGREPTDAELEMLAQTWSEHCVHKTFKAVIEYTGPDGRSETIDGLLKTYIRAATEKVNRPWVRSAFVDNAGIIAFDEQFDLAFKVETHNHPSALEPFGGANTGVGGVVRDVLGVSARPIANTDVLCFGPPDLADVPEGVLHPRRVAEGVIKGIEDYGNKMGIPTVNGAIHYHPSYTANPLVYCGCLGLLPHKAHPTQVGDGDLIVAIGGRTGRDGLRGATFSSMEMDTATSEIAGTAVQIGHPIQEKQVQEVVLKARDESLYTAITDCGAGGYSSAVGEMAQGLGAEVQLQAITLKYPGLRPWEIWLSEAQERMVLSVPPANLPRLQTLCDGQNVELTVLGTFTASGRIRLHYGETFVGDIDVHFLHDGIPQRRLKAEWKVDSGQWTVDSGQLKVASEEKRPVTEPVEVTEASEEKKSAGEILLALLAHPTIRSKEEVIRKYDHEVQGGTAVKPLTGLHNAGPSDAAVIVPLDTLLTDSRHLVSQRNQVSKTKGVALANGICPTYGELDPHAMAWAAIDEALRNIVAVGGDPDQAAILDNFCWGNPNLPDRLGSLVRCAQGCYEAAVAYNTPFISGKDSLNNEYTGADGRKHAIPGTLLISALAIVPDVNKCVTMDLKQAGNFLFVIGETRPELGGSHYALVGGEVRAHHAFAPRPVPSAPARLRAVHQAIQAGLIQACHDCSEGGIGVAVAEMCLAGGLGVEIQLGQAPRDEYYAYAAEEAILFGESLSRFLVEVHPSDVPALQAILGDVPHACIGVIGGEHLSINGRYDQHLLTLPVRDLEKAWRGEQLTVNSEQLIAKSEESQEKREARSSLTINYQLSTIHSPRVLILHANGSNRDRDAALACQLAGGKPEIVHINQLLAGERTLNDYHMLVLPGGFSYGDDLGAGVVWSLDLRYRLQEAVQGFVANGRPVLGICNGFQTLVKAGILPGNTAVSAGNTTAPERSITLTFNQSGHFECRWVHLQSNPLSPCLFTQGLSEPIYCPVAHGEGRLMVRDADTLATLHEQNLIALIYTGEGERIGYPQNPNGSVAHIAGLTNPAGNVLGLMPHPEDHIFPWQNPRWSRGERGLLGLQLFANGIKQA